MVVTQVARSVARTYLFSKETTYGSSVTPAKDIGLVKSFTDSANQAYEARNGQGSAKDIYIKGGYTVPKATLDFEIQHGRPIEWLIYGGTTTHSSTSGDDTHTFVWSDLLPSLTSEVGDPLGTSTTAIVDTVATGLVGNSTEISLDMKGVLKGRTDFIGQNINLSASTVTAPTVNTGAPLGGFQGSMKFGATAVDYLQNWTITCAGNTKDMPGQGLRTPAWVASHDRHITFKATIGEENNTYLAEVLGSSSAITTLEPAAQSITFGADNGVTLGSGKLAFSMLLTGCQFKYDRKADTGDFVTYDLTGTGIPSTCTFVDQIASGAW